MKLQPISRRPGGFTLVELLCVIAIIGLLAALLLPALALGKERAKRMVCLNNEHQLGVGFHLFLQDHNNKFPMQVPVGDGGAVDYVQNGLALGGQFFFSHRIFQTLSNESVLPQELVCPTDTRTAAANMAGLQNSNLSYFVGVKADYNQPMSILAGDRNITKQTYNLPSIEELAPGSRLYWTKIMHHYKGDVLFADAHVEEWNQFLLAANTHGTVSHEVFFLPTVTESPAPAPTPAPARTHSRADATFPTTGLVLETGPAAGGQPAAPLPPAGSLGNDTPQPDGTGAPTGGTMAAGGARTNTPAPPARAGQSQAANPADASPANPAEAGMAPAGTSAAARSFTQSAWWFWLFLLLLLLVLGEAARRLLRRKQQEPASQTPEPTYDWPK